MPAPLTATDLQQSLRPLGEATMLPREAYTSTDVLAWEARNFFAGSWSCVGRLDELRRGDQPQPAGSAGVTQRALQVGDVSVLLTWSGHRPDGSDARPRALANTCRHRGHELLPAGRTATKHSIVCPYHAWTYSLSGALTAAPGFREMPGFEQTQHPLVSLPVEVWHGWVFVNATGDAAPFATHLGAMADLVAPYAPERLVLLARHDYIVAANWKIVIENYHECYHCPLIHPELCRVSPPTSGDNYDLAGAWVGGAMDLRADAVTMSLDGRSDGVAIDGADPRRVLYLGLFPNLLVSLHPDYVMTHRLTPIGPAETSVECSWYFVSGDTDPGYAVEFWDRTNRQDWSACESVQRGCGSPHFRPGPFAPDEDAVHRFVTMVARGYLGHEPHVAVGT
jgi:phenylpropionate dioxygenase-like ring-hydroxylating dioxygenase large terminal subunit